jgi:hypothetical protein
MVNLAYLIGYIDAYLKNAKIVSFLMALETVSMFVYLVIVVREEAVRINVWNQKLV